ncbi:hypothetical protein AFM12_06710 [Jiulongibacter sediminis]|uniref:DUF4440 domain-containing protein n=2 Tax=Jiulongibacter sediminis TaxID=1605367 RepID=A0A0P7C504_9BACT|nr:hypothetical protein AFM12_06710 [Jiulongibacter sediminis]TBX24873.1 hypothetical protein TK44_06715 [Jiulongibacter sediminis]
MFIFCGSISPQRGLSDEDHSVYEPPEATLESSLMSIHLKQTKMKKYSIYLLILLLCNLTVTAQSKAEEGIMANFKEQERCWNAHDLEYYVKAYRDSPESKTIGRSGVTYGVENILANYKKYYNDDNMGHLFFDEITMDRITSKVYYVVGRFNLEYEGKETRRGYFSVIIKKFGDQWLIVSDHSS